MGTQFVRGQRLLSGLIGIHLFLGILAIATFQDYLLPSLLDMAYQATNQLSTVEKIDPMILDQAMAQIKTSAYQQAALAEQGKGLAFHIFWCIMLYLGVNWVRILMGLSWLLGSIVAIPLTILMVVFQFYHPFVVLLFASSLIYGIGGALLLFSPGVNTYIRMMRSIKR